MTVEEALDIAGRFGFDTAAPLDPAKLVFRQEVRDMCAPDKCHNGYGKSWSCPPAGIPFGELAARAGRCHSGILVQTVARLEDSFDFEAMLDAAERHARHMIELADALAAVCPGLFPMGAGSCRRCAECSYPDAPCRFPEKMFSSMEACGLLVSDVCKDNGVSYYYGPNTVAYTSCCLF